MSSALSTSVIVSAGNHLLLAFFSVKPFSFIRSIDVIYIYIYIYVKLFQC